jgi:hypothetical protein
MAFFSAAGVAAIRKAMLRTRPRPTRILPDELIVFPPSGEHITGNELDFPP